MDIIRRCGLATVVGFLLMIVLPVSAGQTCSPPNCDSYVGEQSNNVAYDINIAGDSSNLYDNSYYGNWSAAESFIPQKSNLDGVLIWLQKKGTSVTIPTSNVTVYIETSSGGFPTGNILAYSNISTDSISTSRAWYYFKLNQSLSLTVGTTYQIVFVGQLNGTNGIYFYYYSPTRDADSYSNGSYSYNFGSGWVNLPSMDIYLKTVTNEKGLFQLRQFPYNYSAVLSISSDIDESDISSFVNLHDWMNTNKSNTRYGHGLNLDISDSMWFYKKPLNYNSGTPLHQLSYFDNLTSNYSVDKPIIKQYIDAGYIDTLHSYGDFSSSYSPNITQDNINSAVNEINNNSYTLDVWINHGDEYNTQNIYNTGTFGDVIGQPEYHWNRTKNFTHYIWKSDITGTLNSLDINTWSLTVTNKVSNPFLLPISIVTLRDGSSAWYFYRAGTWSNAKFNDLSISLSMSNLNNLVSNNGWSIIYTHYGADKIPTSDTISAMTNLSNYSNNGTIWVTPTKKQLKYAEVLGFVNWNVTNVGSQNHINIINITSTLRTFVPAVNDLQGLTFYTLDPTNTSIWLNGTRLNTTITGGDPADIYNRSRITVDISSLVYPSIIMPFYTGINMVVYPDSSIDYQNDYNSNILATNTSVITPSSDNITINISIWNTTGDYRKVWNESSTNHSVTTQHKMGNFQANTNILIKKNGIAWNTYTSNSTGYISFNYVDGYSSNIQFDASLASSIPSGPYITVFAPASPVDDIAGASRTFNITVNQNVNVTWYLNGTQVGFNEGVTDASYTNSSASEGFWNVTAIATNTSTGLSASQTWDWYVTSPTLPLEAPNITSFAPPSIVSDITGATRIFNITANQTVNVTWYINGTLAQDNGSVPADILVNYTNTSAAAGFWNVTAIAQNANGTASKEWLWIVSKADTTTAITTISPEPSVVGQNYTVNFSVTVNSSGSGNPTGNVTVNDGDGNICSASVSTSGCSLISTSAGIKTLNTNYSGDSNFNLSSNTTYHQANTRTTATVVSFGTNPVVVGQPSITTLTIADIDNDGTKSSPSGIVNLTSNIKSDIFTPIASCSLVAGGSAAANCSVTITPQSAGVHNIAASYPADSVHSASNGNNGLTVNKADTSTAVISSINPSVSGESVTFTVNVTTVAPGAGLPTGTVLLNDSGVTIGTGTLNSSGQTNFSTSSLSIASHSITATYLGDDNFNNSASSALYQVVNRPAAPSIISWGNSKTNDQSLTLTTNTTENVSFNITVNQTVNVTWYLNGTLKQTDTSVTNSSYTNTSAAAGFWNVTAIASNADGTDTHKWDWNVTPQILTSIVVSPSTASLTEGGNQPFNATALDQNNKPMSGINISWTVSNLTVGNLTPLFALTGSDGNASTTFVASVASAAIVNATNGSITGNASVTVKPGTSAITLKPYSGPSGTNVTVNGSGFKKMKTITIKFNGSTVKTSPSPCSSNNKGSFSCTFTAVFTAPNGYIVQASDGTYICSAIFWGTKP